MRRLSPALVLALSALAPAPAAADEQPRFFAEGKADERTTAIDGSLTSTTFFYQETAVLADPLVDGNTPTRTASPVGRLFTDLRAQLDARHISGGPFRVHADVRGRYSQTQVNPDGDAGNRIPTQSGTFSGNEVEARELYLHRDGKEYDVFVGRKFSLELAAVKFDGVEIQRRADAHWTYLGFAGLYPTRGSRNLGDDYPKGLVDPVNPEAGVKRIVPATGGLGAAYRFERYYGALGAVAIFPLARDLATQGQIEKPRVFATANGYWRKSERLDVYHYLVIDAMGAAGAGLTNLTLGLGFQPRQAVRLSAQVTRVDTETLNVQAQTQLENPDGGATLLQNNIEVRRVAQESARLGLSVGFAQNRFELSSHGTLRRRPALSIPTGDGMGSVEFADAQAADLYLGFVDRRGWKDLRLGASIVRSIGVGKVNLNRSRSTVVRLDARRELADGRAELEGELTYLAASDDDRGTVCDPAALETCYGSSAVSSVSLGGVGYLRLNPTWFAIGGVTLGRVSQTATDNAGAAIDLPPITTASLFLRIAKRF